MSWLLFLSLCTFSYSSSAENTTYLGGPVMSSGINVYMIFYGSWNTSTSSRITSFVRSLGSTDPVQSPNLPKWWSIVTGYSDASSAHVQSNITYKASFKFPSSSYFPSLTLNSTSDALSIISVALNQSFPVDDNGVYIILTARDVNVSFSCETCAVYYFFFSGAYTIQYMWTHEATAECSRCHSFTDSFLPPSGDLAADGTIFNLAWGIPNVAVDPEYTGWGTNKTKPYAARCLRAYGDVLFQNRTTGGRYNIYGINNETFLVSQLYDLVGSQCSLQASASAPSLPSPPPPSSYLFPSPPPPPSPSSSPLPQSPPLPPSESKKSSSAVIIIAAAASASGLFLLALAAALVCCCKYKRNEKQPFYLIDFGAPVIPGEVVDVGDGHFTRRFTFQEVMAATDSFNEDNLLGKGGFGSVYKGNFSEGNQWAVKRANSRVSDELVSFFILEVKVIAKVNHPNLVSLKGFCDEGGEQILVYEFVDNGNVKQHIQRDEKYGGKTLTVDQRINIAFDAAKGLDYLHGVAGAPIIHRDVKSENILLDHRLTAKVADFGLVKTLDIEGMTRVTADVVGTYGYMDPEYINTRKVTPKSDVYSFGVILFELVTGRKPVFVLSNELVEDRNYESLVAWVKRSMSQGGIGSVVDSSLESNYHLEVIDAMIKLALQCTTYTSSQRPTMREVMSELDKIRKENRILSGLESRSHGNAQFSSSPVLLPPPNHLRMQHGSTDVSLTEDSTMAFRAPVSFMEEGR